MTDEYKVSTTSFASLARRGRVWLAALFATLSAATSASAFRTAAELPKLSSPVTVRYEGTTFDYWVVRSSFPRDLVDFQPQDTIVEAAQVWAEPACSNARPQLRGLGTDPAAAGDGVNSVQWVSDWEARGLDPKAAGYTDAQFSREEGGNWAIAEADIYLNANFQWSLEDKPEPPLRSVKAVVAHEFGHALGLLHPCETDDEPRCSASNDATVTMYPVYSPDQADLAADDIAGICFLYPTPDCSVAGCPSGSICSDGACRVECEGTLCDPGSICSAGRCQRPSPCPGNSCVGRSCSKDSQCGVFEHCDATNGRCAQGTRTEGQACSQSLDCARGLCFEGVCRNRCTGTGDCDQQHDCQPADDEFSVCMPHGSPVGASCTSPLDCADGRCLLNAKPSPICTRDCGPNYPTCPIGWSCGSAEGQAVCVPIRPTGGCSIQTLPSRSPQETPEVGGLLIALAFAFARYRRRKASHTATTEHP